MARDEVRLNIDVHDVRHNLIEEANRAWNGVPMTPDSGQVELNFDPEACTHLFTLYGVNTVAVASLSSPQDVEPAAYLLGKAMHRLSEETCCLIEYAELDGTDRPYEFYFEGVYDIEKP